MSIAFEPIGEVISINRGVRMREAAVVDHKFIFQVDLPPLTVGIVKTLNLSGSARQDEDLAGRAARNGDELPNQLKRFA